eukprot:1590661-Rhodomonas_salina.1
MGAPIESGADTYPRGGGRGQGGGMEEWRAAGRERGRGREGKMEREAEKEGVKILVQQHSAHTALAWSGLSRGGGERGRKREPGGRGGVDRERARD